MSGVRPCLEALLMQSQVLAACSQSRSLLSIPPLVSLMPAWQQQSGFCTSQFSTSSQQPETGSDSGAAAAAPAPSQDSSTAATTNSIASASKISEQQHQSPTANSDSSGFMDGTPAAGQHHSRRSEQQQTNINQQLAANEALPAERLRIMYTHETKQQAAQVQVDAYSLSRSLVHDQPAVNAADQPQQQQLTAADKETLEKLVGILTKDGKKSRARRLLLDAMHIVKQQLSKGGV